MVLCEKCGKEISNELGLVKVHNYGGQRLCENCKKRRWKTAYYAKRNSDEKTIN